MNHFGFVVFAISLLQLGCFGVRRTHSFTFTDKGVIQEQQQGKVVTSRPTLKTNIVGADADKGVMQERQRGKGVTIRPTRRSRARRSRRARGSRARGREVTSRPTPKTNTRAKRLKHAYFDFDQTITRIHVYSSLAALRSFVEIGQVHKLMDLDKTTWQYNEASSKVVADDAGTPWSIAALGGTDRIDTLRHYLTVLKKAGVKLTVITKGNVGAARYILEKADLLHFFETVYGNIGDFWGLGTRYDKKHRVATGYEGNSDVNLKNWKGKVGLITDLMEQNDATFSEAVLVEDDAREIRSVRNTCEAVHVQKRQGMESSHLKEIIALAGV